MNFGFSTKSREQVLEKKLMPRLVACLCLRRRRTRKSRFASKRLRLAWKDKMRRWRANAATAAELSAALLVQPMLAKQIPAAAMLAMPAQCPLQVGAPLSLPAEAQRTPKMPERMRTVRAPRRVAARRVAGAARPQRQRMARQRRMRRREASKKSLHLLAGNQSCLS